LNPPLRRGTLPDTPEAGATTYQGDLMSQTNQAYDLEISSLRDEELVVLAQECGYMPARQELLRRCFEWEMRLVTTLTRAAHLQVADAEDAQGAAVLSLLEAIARYDTGQLGRRNGRSFRSFCAVVLGDRFRDFLRKLRSDSRRHVLTPFEANLRTENSVRYRRDLYHGEPPSGVEQDPARLAELREQAARLQLALARINDLSRSLWEHLASGGPLVDFAMQQGITYDGVRRLRDQTCRDLKALLKPGG
jgi:hypothetical protein